ncbi:MAG: hypothetical protein QXE01_11210 [Sulfolobales archaeon]
MMSASAKIISGRYPRFFMNVDLDIAISKFFLKLQNVLKDNLVGVIIPAGEVYESNVLVIVRKRDVETILEITKTALEVEDEYRGKVSINPYIALESEESVIRVFREAVDENQGDPKIQREALKIFRERLLRLGYISDVIIPNAEIYQSNVLIIVKRRDLETISEIIRIAMEIEGQYAGRVSISPYIALESEENVIKTFKEASGGSI